MTVDVLVESVTPTVVVTAPTVEVEVEVVGGRGVQGEPGEKGEKGDTGAASTVPGPPGAKGDKGDPGDDSTVPGPPGADSTVPGPAGATGATGPAGSPGTKIHAAAGSPVTATGALGDFYLDTAADTLYGPKAPEGVYADHEIVMPPLLAPNSPNFTLGVKFKVTEPCFCTGILFQVAPADTVLTGWKIKLYRQSTQALLATKTVTVANGINRFNFDTQVALTPDVIYLSAVFNPPATAFLYKSDYVGPMDSGPLHLLKNNEDGASTGRYTGTDGYPSTDWGQTLCGTPTPLIRVTDPIWPVALQGVV